MQAHPVIHQSQQGICSAAGRIPEGLYGHYPFKWRIKKIQEANDGMFHF
jgi:hypothetical protein